MANETPNNATISVIAGSIIGGMLVRHSYELVNDDKMIDLCVILANKLYARTQHINSPQPTQQPAINSGQGAKNKRKDS